MADLSFETKKLAPDRLWLRASGDVDGADMVVLKKWISETAVLIEGMHKSFGSPIACIFDLLGIEAMHNPEVVSALIEFQKTNKPHIRRTALLVKEPSVRLALSVIGVMADRYNVRSFASNQEAEHWAFSNQE